MAIRLSGTFKKFEGGLKLSKAVPPQWWEDDAYVAFDADSGAIMPNHGVSLTSVSTSSTQTLPGKTSSYYFAGGNSTNRIINFTRSDANTNRLYTTDYTIQYKIYIVGDMSSYTRLGYPLRINNTGGIYYRLLFENTNPDPLAGSFVYIDNSPSGGSTAGINRSDFPENEWLTVKVTHNDTTGVHKLYVNDVEKASVSNAIGQYTASYERFELPGIALYLDEYQIVPRII